MTTTRRSRAFTLLEAMFASSILIMGLASTAGVYNMVSASFAHQRDMAIATTIGEAFLEQVSILPQSSPLLALNDSHVTRHYDASGRRVATASQGKFKLDWQVSPFSFSPGVKEIVVDISWTGNRTHNVQFFTFRE